MPEFNVADGSVATVLKEGSPLALIKGYQPNTWLYAPRAARIARDGSNRPLLSVIRNQKRKPNGSFETLGGTFAAQLELAVPIPTLQEQKEWTEHIGIVSSIKPNGNTGFRFQPMRLQSGTMSILGVDQFVTDPSKVHNIPIGASSTIPVSLELNPLGADTFATALGSATAKGFPAVVALEFKYEMILPRCHYKITANNERTYNFFSMNTKARASWWGWVGAQSDISSTRSELVDKGCIKIEQISPPEGLDDARIKQLEATLIDAWIKRTLAMIANQPRMEPAVAPDPRGFFGGVSVSMKSYSEVSSLDLTAEFAFSQLREERYNLSYVFVNLFDQLSPKDYLLEVSGDNQLPITVNLTKDERVHTYNAQYGYNRADGTFVGFSLNQVPGDQGAVLTGILQWQQTEPIPTNTTVLLAVDWKDGNWQDRTERHVVKNVINGDSAGALYQWTPGNNIADMSVVTDLEMLPAGWTSVIQWNTVIPKVDGMTSKVYLGGLVLKGAGADGALKSSALSFPYFEGVQSDVKVKWKVLIIGTGSGQTYTREGETRALDPIIPLFKAQLLGGVEPQHLGPQMLHGNGRHLSAGAELELIRAFLSGADGAEAASPLPRPTLVHLGEQSVVEGAAF